VLTADGNSTPMGEVNNLNFGHFGTATYDVDNSEWTFSRKLDRHELVPLGHWRTVVPASIHFPTPALSRPAPNVQQNVKALVRDCPDLVPAIEHLAELEIVSAAATSATFTYDATVGDLLSFGNITCRGHADHGSKHVVATAMGEVGNILRLEVSLTERYGWGDIDKLKGTMMEGPSMTSGECGYWNEEAAPIQQICFAQTEARSSFLAVRFNSRTVVFRPSYLHRRKATPSAYFDLPPSSVDARPILSISGKETGGASHAHVSFNPDYQRQFGIVDQRGQWSIWDIEFGHQNSKHTVHCSARGNIVSVEDESEDEDGNKKAYKEDGWARITWVGDATTIMMANRRHIRLFNFRSGSISLKCPPLLSTNSADWILDLKKHPSNKSQIFVLTSTRLYLLAVTCLSDDGENEHVDAGATVLVSWTHYRGTEDITLQLCLHTLGNDSLVLIHSRLNRLATIFQFATRGSGRSDRIYASDPVSINLQGLEEAAGSSYIRQMHLDQLQFKRAPKIHDPDLERLYAEEDVNFYRLNVMLSDLSIREILLYSCNGNRKRSSLQIEPVSRISFVRIRGCYGENLVDEDDMKDFIVPDGLTIARLPVLKNPYELPKTLERRTAPPAWYFYDYGSFYKTLVQPAPTVVDEGLLETADLAVVVNEVKRLLLDHSISAEPVLGTL
jgi:RNA polymerase I-specific transcription initiation factor RRN6